MIIKAVKTRKFLPPRDDLLSLIKESFSDLKLKEKSIFVITSKIVSIWQGRCLKMELTEEKDELIKKEAELYLEREKVSKGDVILTIKENLLIPTAGIDESNGNGYFVLWPKESYKAAKKIYKFIKKKFHLKNFGIIISDSHTVPLRLGTMGMALAYYGFYPLRDYRGKKDIFGRIMKITQFNIADSLAAAAVAVMGEGREQTPIAIIEDVKNVEFKKFDPEKFNPLKIDRNDDIYAPLLKGIKWQRGYQKK
jgi:putative folate metabolism gamma-glutamate ligase